MLRALDPDDPFPPPAYRVPWRVDRADRRHPLIMNASSSAVDFVRVFADDGPPSTTEHWGQMVPGESAELCLCTVDSDGAIVTIGWFRPEDGNEYLWRFVT
ncbi:hypothetical protein [Microbacterium sp. NPDC056569]|uniref:hypothetical protein n=1 Tax=Microbacterium sp. NPDC056569 TaxID=3345867 RepID=UPI00366C3720